MQVLSQNDPRWKNEKLGTSNVTIGNYGCTITCIAMIVGTTPDIVNKRLKEVNGFAEGNLVIWAKIEEAFPGIKVRRVWTYNNEDVKKNLPAIVEVDGQPIGGYRHFVIYVGNQKLYDPWDGHIDPTSDYPNPVSYALLTGSWESQSGEVMTTISQKELDEIRLARDSHYNETVRLKDELEAVKKERDESNKAMVTLNSKIENLNEAMAKDAINDKDLLLQSKKYEEERDQANSNLKDIALELKLSKYDFKSVIEAIQNLKRPIDEHLEPILRDRNMLYKVFIDQGAGIYKRMPAKTKSLLQKIVDYLHKYER